MKTLKKTLCLILAVVMVVGVLILPANAASIKDYKDNEDIKYKEAVEVLSGLGILGGKDTGYFAPKGTLTRAEAAKIIAWMLLGKDAEKLHSNTQIFADVAADNWAAGYIAFCKNEGILAGDGAGNFRPNGELNGVDFGKMLLTALGYDAKLEGYVLNKDWDKNVTTQMLNKNSYIDIGTVLSNPMTREEAAQMAFLALQQSTVKYPATIYGANQYRPTGTTLGASFGLKRVKGVMTANEYADLNSNRPAGNGKSVIDGETYNYASDLTEIGLYYEGWACGLSGTKTIIHLDAVGNTVYENDGVATDLANFKRVTGLDEDDKSTVYFTNFGDEGSKNTADIRIRYELAAGVTDLDTVETGLQAKYNNLVSGLSAVNGVYSKIIPANGVLTDLDVDIIRFIFDYADLVEDGTYKLGEVYVGTQSKDDISDTMSYKKFVSTYITTDADNGGDFDSVAQGNWLKVIDNDGDGKADYVFRINFIMTTVEKVAKNGQLTLNGLAATYDYATSADLAVGDVVIYTSTKIDGKYYVEPAPSFTGKVDKYTYKTDVLTVKGEDYPQSEIGGDTVMGNAGYFTKVVNAQKNTEYTYYQDFFGNIRAFEVPANAARDLVLLTNAYYRTGRTEDVKAVMAYLDGELNDYDVSTARNADGGYINAKGDNNNWGKLIVFADYANATRTAESFGNYTSSDADGLTNLARYSQNSDGVLSLSNVKTYTYGKNGTKNGIATDYVDLAEDAFKAGQNTYTGKYTLSTDDKALAATVDTGDKIAVQANETTVFYYYDHATESVVSVTGRRNSYPVDADNVVEAYAVATNIDSDANGRHYWVADAIVIETKWPVYNGASSVVLGYNLYSRSVSDYFTLDSVMSDGALESLDVVRYDGTNVVDFNSTNYTAIRNALPTFYRNAEMDGESYIAAITGNYAAYGILAGKVFEINDLRSDAYLVLDSRFGRTLDFDPDTIAIYRLKTDGNTTSAVTTDAASNDLELTKNESYIFYTNGRGDIIYAILVEDPAAYDTNKVSGLFQKIQKDGLPAADELTLKSLKIKGQKVTLDQKTKTGTVTLKYEEWSENSSFAQAEGTGSAGTVTCYQKDKVTQLTGNTALTNDGKFATVYAVVTNGAESVTYTITVTLEPAEAKLLKLEVKGLEIPIPAAATGADIEITVPLLDGGHNVNTVVNQISAIEVSQKATWAVEDGAAGAATGIATSGTNATSTVTSLTAGANKSFTITVTSGDTETTQKYVIKFTTIEAAWTATIDASGAASNLTLSVEDSDVFDNTKDFTFTIEADEGYYLLASTIQVKVGSGSPITGDDKITVTTVEANKKYTVTVKAAELTAVDNSSNKLTITATAVANPKITATTAKTINGEVVNASGTYTVEYGADVVVTVASSVGGLSVSSGSQGSEYDSISGPTSSGMDGFVNYTIKGVKGDITLD